MRPTLSASFISLVVFARLLGAQTADSARHTGPIFTGRDVVYAGAFAAGTIALLPLDRPIAKAMQRPGLQHDRFLRHAATDLRLVGIPGTLIAMPALYVAGRIGHHERMADLGLHGGEAIVLAEVVGFIIKGTAGRARPYVVSDTNPYVFSPGRGFHDDRYVSLPSGHTLAAFATAAAVTAETSRWWPHSTAYIAPLMYGSATLIGLSRMYNDQHWASDVMLAAGIGTLSGITVVRFNHAHPRNVINRWFLSTSVIPTAGGGMALAWSMPTRW